MKVLFAVGNSENSENDIVEKILNEYQKQYKKIISYKRAFYYEAIINEIQQTREKKYDVIVISEDLEKNMNDSYESEDLSLYKHIDQITDEAYKDDGTGIPVVLICSDRRSEKDPIIQQLFVLGVYNILFGKDRSIQNVAALIEHPRNKKTAKIVYNIQAKALEYKNDNSNKVISDKELMNIIKFFNINRDKIDKCVNGFLKLYKEYNEEQLQTIINNLPLDVRIILEDHSKEYNAISKVSVKNLRKNSENSFELKDLKKESYMDSSDVIIPNQGTKTSIFKKFKERK